jgi:hypothetical protein
MSKRIILLLFSILLIVLLVTNFFFFQGRGTSVRTQLYSLVDFQPLTDDPTHGILTIDLTIELPVKYKDKRVLDSISSQVITNIFGRSYINIPTDSLLRQFANELKSDYLESNILMVQKLDPTDLLLFNYSFSLEGFALMNDQNIFTYGIARNIDFGGNHPTQTRFFYNYDLSTGNLITEYDIFSPDSIHRLTQVLRDEIKRLSREDDTMPTIESYAGSVYDKSAIRPNGNFYINDQGICYVFNPYEIAPMSYAYETEVLLPYSLIEPMMLSNSPLQYLVQQHKATFNSNN